MVAIAREIPPAQAHRHPAAYQELEHPELDIQHGERDVRLLPQLPVAVVYNLAITFNTHIVEVLALGYFIRVCFSQFAFLLVLLVTERKKTALFLYRFTPLMSPYTGYFLRIARLSAHLQELFFRTSYKDAWNPKKTSRYAQLEGI